MANKEDGSFSHSLSRKELQSWCKKYGLPANRSSSDMAKSLASFLENHRLGSLTAGERLYEIQEVGLPLSMKLQLQSGSLINSLKDAGKDFYGLISCPRDRCNGGNYSEAVKCNALGCCGGNKFSEKDCYGGSIIFQQTPLAQCVSLHEKNKEFQTICVNKNCSSITDQRMNNMPPQIEHRSRNVCACSNETTFPSSIITPTTVSPPSFEFYVSSEEGINLCVDLNSNPWEWVGKLKREVSICQSMPHSKSRTFHKELGCIGESSEQIKSSSESNLDAGKINDGCEHTGLPSSLIIKENNGLQVNHPDGYDEPLGSAVDVAEQLEEVRGPTLIEGYPDSENQRTSGGVCCAKNGYIIKLDSNIDSPKEKLVGDGVTSISDGPIGPLTMEHQNSKIKYGICENAILQNDLNLVSPTKIFPGCLEAGSREIQMPKDVVHLKELSHSPSENGEFLDLVHSERDICAEKGGSGSTEADQVTCMNQLPTLVEEQGRGKIINGRESSECSQDKLVEKNCRGLDNVESNGLGEKRTGVDGDQSDCSMLHSKTLRRKKHLIGKVLPRGSMRLVSKVAASFFGEQFFSETE